MLEVKEEDLTKEQKEALDLVLDEKLSVVILHKKTNEFAGKDITAREIPALVHATLKSYKESHPDRAHDTTDFVIIRVNFETKNISIQAIE